MEEEILNKKPEKADDVEKYTDIEFGEGVVKIKKDTGEVETNKLSRTEELETGLRPMTPLELYKKTNLKIYDDIMREAKEMVGERKDLIIREAEIIAKRRKAAEEN